MEQVGIDGDTGAGGPYAVPLTLPPDDPLVHVLNL